MTSDRPLVSVGIPTYNRLEKLQLAVSSALAQDYPNLEVVVCDNASTDGTDEWLRDAASAHPQLVHRRNDVNIGPTANFNRARAESTGELLLWLGDDDVLDPRYVSACVARLEADPEAVMASGAVEYDHGSGPFRRGVPLTCTEADGSSRVLSYYRQVRDNGTFYGVTRRTAADRLQPMANRMGNDWYLMAGLAVQGRLLLVEDVSVVRSVGGATRSLRHVARGANLTWLEAEVPQLTIAALAGRDIAWAAPVYEPLGRVGRVWLALRVSGTIVVRFVIPSIPKYLRLLADRVRWRESPPDR